MQSAVNGSELRSTHFLVTGGGSGIGKAIAKRLTAGGATVVIAGRTPEKLMKAAGEIASDRLFTMTLDIADCERIPEKLAEAEVSRADSTDLSTRRLSAGIRRSDAVLSRGT